MKNFIKQNRAFTAYIIIALILGIAGVITAPGNELLYMILAQYLILPLAGLICSACAVKKGKALGFLSPFVFIAVATLLPFLVFRSTDVVFLIFSGVPCLIGYIFGLIGYALSGKKRKADKTEKQELKLEKKQDKAEAKAEKDEFSVENDDANSSESNATEEQEEEEPAILVAD